MSPLVSPTPDAVQAASHDFTTRPAWWRFAARLAGPVLAAAAGHRLRRSLPCETNSSPYPGHEIHSPFEALARTLAGIAPWLEAPNLVGEEALVRDRLSEQARQALASIVDPASPDRMVFCEPVPPLNGEFSPNQGLVSSALLAVALLRAPRSLWTDLDASTRTRLVEALKTSRRVWTYYNNWLLFAAVIETFLHTADAGPDPMRIDYALRQHELWYAGDGVYKDGPEFHHDYYNSFVIVPFLQEVMRVFGAHQPYWCQHREPVARRARRHAVQMERMISPEGTFPALGRSLAYRFGVLHGLAQVARLDELPPELPPGQARAAMGAVLRRFAEAPDLVDRNGWLRLGFVAHDPELAEPYVATGSAYYCMLAFLPLGLSPDAAFWRDPARLWTTARLWAGQSTHRDQALHG